MAEEEIKTTTPEEARKARTLEFQRKLTETVNDARAALRDEFDQRVKGFEAILVSFRTDLTSKTEQIEKLQAELAKNTEADFNRIDQFNLTVENLSNQLKSKSAEVGDMSEGVSKLRVDHASLMRKCKRLEQALTAAGIEVPSDEV
jgi:chromosome segregation ATPase